MSGGLGNANVALLGKDLGSVTIPAAAALDLTASAATQAKGKSGASGH